MVLGPVGQFALLAVILTAISVGCDRQESTAPSPIAAGPPDGVTARTPCYVRFANGQVVGCRAQGGGVRWSHAAEFGSARVGFPQVLSSITYPRFDRRRREPVHAHRWEVVSLDEAARARRPLGDLKARFIERMRAGTLGW